MPEQITIRYTREDLGVGEFAHPEWERAGETLIDKYWSGGEAPAGRHFAARLLWSDSSLLVRFDARQTEQLVVAAEPVLATKTIGLWERDVCEIFIAPDRQHPEAYFEFEVAPTGEWLDLHIRLDRGERITDSSYESGMETAAELSDGSYSAVIKVPFESLDGRPMAGDVWAGNIFRCVGSGPGRGFLAWRPTFTELPNFHVPSRFGPLVFEK